MTTHELSIVHGPDKPALQWSLAYPETHKVRFDVESDAFDAQILRMDEQSDGFTFALNGRLASGPLKGAPFTATYSVESRSGALKIQH